MMAKRGSAGIKCGSARGLDGGSDGAKALSRWSNHGCIIMPGMPGKIESGHKRQAKSLPIATAPGDQQCAGSKTNSQEER